MRDARRTKSARTAAGLKLHVGVSARMDSNPGPSGALLAVDLARTLWIARLAASVLLAWWR